MSEESTPRRRQRHQPRLAEVIAGILRERILSGSLSGDKLPSQDRLLEEFGVSRPPMREALRILETEGLITVRRGNVGGADVHMPQTLGAAYSLGLILESRNVTLADVGLALRELEPLCSALCARRQDRATAVVPRLEEVHGRALESLDDELELTRLTSVFHELLVTLCGNETLASIVGAIESLWLAHVGAWAEDVLEAGGFPDRASREQSLATHGLMISLISRGEDAEVLRLATEHFEPGRFYRTPADAQQTVRAQVLRPAART
jgi:DNA-binding FadR family transcriptional regulator